MAVQRLGDVAVETVVKFNESGSSVEFIVVQQGSPSNLYVNFQRATIVCRKDIYNKQVTQHAFTGALKNWLNNASTGYLSLFDDSIRANLVNVKIPYVGGKLNAADHIIYSGSSGLSVKAFLPSMTELGLWPDFGEGNIFPYFTNNVSRIALFEGKQTPYWTRTPDFAESEYEDSVQSITANGTQANPTKYINTELGVRPFIALSKDLFVDQDLNVFANQPPTAPGSIEVSGVVSGGSATITLTAAADPDGTVESYIYERQVDGGAWQQVAQANSLTQTDQISEDWGTVAYRACAVDDMGASGPYVTGETQTINSGWVTIGGPAEAMGSKPAPFDFDFSASVSGVASTGAITVYATLDGEQVYSGTPSAGEQISIPIDTRLMGAGEHAIEVQASRDDYLPASKRYTFTVPAVTIPAGGTGEQAQGSDGRPVFHTTLAQRCIGRGGVDIQAQVDALTARVKTLEG